MFIKAAKKPGKSLVPFLLIFTLLTFTGGSLSPADAAAGDSKLSGSAGNGQTIGGEIAGTTAVYEEVTVSGEITAPDGHWVTLVAGGTEMDIVVGKTYRDARFIVTPQIDFPVSLAVRDWDSTASAIGTAELNPTTSPFGWRTALYLDDGIKQEYSAAGAAAGGRVTDSEADGVTIASETDDFSALMIERGTYTLKNSTIVLDSNASGGTTNDFIGLGAAISATTPAKWAMAGMPGGPGGPGGPERQGQPDGSGGPGVAGMPGAPGRSEAAAGGMEDSDAGSTVLTIENTSVVTKGVAKSGLFVDNGADVIVKGSKIRTYGGTLYGTYMSNAVQNTMITPPWILGIDNRYANARASNLMGRYSTETLVDTDVYASGWGALSVDDGKYMRMDTINTDVEVKNSGYGAFAIGLSTAAYYGTRFDVDRYAMVMMGGHATFTSYTGGDEITIRKMKAKGTGIDEFRAVEDTSKADIATVSSSEVKTGKKIYSKIVSGSVGFTIQSMMLSDALSTVTLLDGTRVETVDEVFQIKSGFGEFTIDNADVSSKNGLILQMMDNDDAFEGNTDFSHGVFGECFREPDGWSYEFEDNDPSDNYAPVPYGTVGQKGLGKWYVNLNVTNAALKGDLWNSTGYWTQGGSDLNVTIGEGASLAGLISAGAYRHIVKAYTVGSSFDALTMDNFDMSSREFTGSWAGAHNIGKVTNTQYYHGANDVRVTVENGGEWVVTDTSYVTALSVDKDSSIRCGSISRITQDTDGNVVKKEDISYNGGKPLSLPPIDQYAYYRIEPASP